MPSTTTYRHGQVVVVNVPFTGQGGGKRRPALVISVDAFHKKLPDVIICPITGALASMSKPLARDLVEVAETTDKPICVIWGSPVTEGEKAYEMLLSSPKVVTFRTFANCIGAVKAYFDHHAFAALDAADSGDQTGTVNGIVIHVIGGERRELQKR